MTVEEIVAELNETPPEDREAVLRSLMRRYTGDDKAIVEPWLAERIIIMGTGPLVPRKP